MSNQRQDHSYVYVALVQEDAQIPNRATERSAGFDLCSLNNYSVGVNCIQIVDTGIQLVLPRDKFGYITGRSSYSAQKIFVIPGVIDSDYYLTLKIVVLNASDEILEITKRDRVAQLLILPTFQNNLRVLPPQTVYPVRNQDVYDHSGFGSTGK